MPTQEVIRSRPKANENGSYFKTGIIFDLVKKLVIIDIYNKMKRSNNKDPSVREFVKEMMMDWIIHTILNLYNNRRRRLERILQTHQLCMSNNSNNNSTTTSW